MRGRSGFDLPLFFGLLAFSALLQGCIAHSFMSRGAVADSIADEAGWRGSDIETAEFRLRHYAPAARRPRDRIVVYIEGDGLPWKDRASPSSDPTPRDPIALRMAVSHGARDAVYLARPCQYTLALDKTRCDRRYWTNARYAPAVIDAFAQALDQVKSRYRAREFVLVGYSGGGVVAALLAARRSDVSALVTVAANLDTDHWTRHHRVTPLFNSLNPADHGKQLMSLPQIHFVGEDDAVVPGHVVQSYARKVDGSLLRTIRLVDGVDHTCCWADIWPTLLRDAIPRG